MQETKNSRIAATAVGEKKLMVSRPVTDTFFGDEGRGYVQEVHGGIKKAIFLLAG